jgi:hypothetical protein
VLFLALYHPSFIKHRLTYFVIAGLTYFILYLIYLMFERNTDRVRTSALKLLMRRPNTGTE